MQESAVASSLHPFLSPLQILSPLPHLFSSERRGSRKEGKSIGGEGVKTRGGKCRIERVEGLGRLREVGAQKGDMRGTRAQVGRKRVGKEGKVEGGSAAFLI